MKLKDLFQKDIERQIQAVVVIDDKEEEKVEQELDEFVVTDELEQYLELFFTAFNESFRAPTDRMGVWISGFFGSGKSHFLKILSYLLDSGMIVGGKKPIDYFQDKIAAVKTYEKMKDVSDNENEVILFNIDSKSGSNTKQQKLAIVKVFNKVFNEYRGYSPTIPWMAHLEEILDSDGRYEAFKRSFEEKAGLSWEDGRDEVFYNEDEIIEALVETTDMSEDSARRWITNGEENYDVSSESLARRIKKYVDQKPKNFRLIFMVDEMGQYISDNKELMLELQTVVEDLGRFTKGKVWVVVTSQQSLVSLEQDKNSSDDFSKIQGRFATRLSLSSANADEVIKKRLLSKSDVGNETLQIVYDERTQAMLRNKLSFSNDTMTLRKYDEPNDFYEFYPLIPYQVSLLQRVLEEIRRHGLAGTSVSTGERNLLGTIQLAILQYKEEGMGTLIPFQAFYENLNRSLDYSVRSTVIKAENNDSLNDFDVEVLKLLFLIRYIEGITANVENITTLMLTTLDQDRLTFSKEVEASLNRLVKEYLVQRNGLEYTFLTNEEQDINREIVNIDVPTSNLLNRLGEIVFSDILDMKKYTYYPFENKKNINYTYDISRWIDDRVISMANAEMGVRVITPYSDYYQVPELLLQLSSRENQVIVELDATGTFYDDMLMIMKIDQYFRTYSSRSRSDLEQDILQKKQRDRNKLTDSVQLQLKNALQHARIYVYGAEVPNNTHSSPSATIETGLRQLVMNLYPNVPYIKKFYRRDDYPAVIRENTIDLLDIEESDPNHLATDEIMRYIYRQDERKITMTLWNIIQEFTAKPFGWRMEDILVSIIRLMKVEKLSLKSNQNTVRVDDPVFDRQISNRDSQERIIVEKREVLDEKLVREAKRLVKDLFGYSPVETREDSLMNEIRERFKRLTRELTQMLENYRHRYYPGEKEVKLYLEDIQKVLRHQQTNQFFAALVDEADNLRDDYEEYLDVKNLFEYNQQIFDDAYGIQKRFVNDQTMIQLEETREAGQRITDIVKMARPYQYVVELPNLVKQYKDAISREVSREVEPLEAELERTREILVNAIQHDDALKERFTRILRNRFEDLSRKIGEANTLKDISAVSAEIEHVKIQLSSQINRVSAELEEERQRKREREARERLAREQVKPASVEVSTIPEPTPAPIIHEPSPVLVDIDKVLPYSQYKIKNEAELEQFMTELHTKLRAKLKDDKYIQFI
ncbi:BREX system P-loop protein BrxC [Jeotgalibaca caeni]|uniref:BREX system P-loop protein BrxC n=1 Tax=Jeotgalibaca caeni TaxID=3028623 RepID=UPI00237D5D3C|nr:BREX system P-loop protein BrxC [Jeotgalibaca caeni]MDE1549166.1 BREX system P-loop protein BrxC [Jeotgalibaca caeni]